MTEHEWIDRQYDFDTQRQHPETVYPPLGNPDSDGPDGEGTRSRDPVHAEWFFWDETWTKREGPFESESFARDALEQYVEWLGGRAE